MEENIQKEEISLQNNDKPIEIKEIEKKKKVDLPNT